MTPVKNDWSNMDPTYHQHGSNFSPTWIQHLSSKRTQVWLAVIADGLQIRRQKCLDFNIWMVENELMALNGLRVAQKYITWVLLVKSERIFWKIDGWKMKILFEIVPFQGTNSLICGVLGFKFQRRKLEVRSRQRGSCLVGGFWFAGFDGWNFLWCFEI